MRAFRLVGTLHVQPSGHYMPTTYTVLYTCSWMYSFVALGCTGTSEYTKFSISARTDLPVRVNLPVDLNLALDGPKNSDFKYLQVIILNLVSLLAL